MPRIFQKKKGILKSPKLFQGLSKVVKTKSDQESIDREPVAQKKKKKSPAVQNKKDILQNL